MNENDNEQHNPAVTPGNWRVVPVGDRADIRTDIGYDHRGAAVATAADSEFGAMSRADAEYVVAAISDRARLEAELAVIRRNPRDFERDTGWHRAAVANDPGQALGFMIDLYNSLRAAEARAKKAEALLAEMRESRS